VNEVLATCFTETTTLGIRYELVRRATLEREEVIVRVGSTATRVKLAMRPDGPSAKAENDDVQVHGGRAARRNARHDAERQALIKNQDE
jgi:hypothetical protein